VLARLGEALSLRAIPTSQNLAIRCGWKLRAMQPPKT
jgi:hypothetical protein